MNSRNNRIKTYKLSDSFDINEISEKSNFSFLFDESSESLKTLFDTFDWRLYKNDLMLIRENKSYYLYNLNSNREFAKLTLKSQKLPAFSWNFPESELKKKLTEHLGVRALMPIIDLTENLKIFSILNDDQKTVARLYFRSVQHRKKINPNITSLTLSSLRGYENEFSQLNKILMSEGLTRSKNIYLEAIKSSGAIPGGYSSKLNIKLETEMTSSEAVNIILKQLLETINLNEKGIKKDIDTEFLHDFRVAVRRARSAISQFKYVLPPDIAIKIRSDFSAIGKMTNRLRDLDVYLLKKAEYTDMLPAELRNGLDSVFKKLSIKRRNELKKLKEELSKKHYKNIIENAQNYIKMDYPPESRGKNADIAAILLSKKYIWKKYTKIISSGLTIKDNTPDSALHDLRIECKKLRYLLEFFYSLYPPDQMDKMIMQLKRLQDNLGDFNDLYIQQQSLKEMLANYNSKDRQFISVSMSIGGLISVLNSRQQRVRLLFNDRFTEFSKKINRKQFKRLFTIK
jgi:CHAD domain-containing protein